MPTITSMCSQSAPAAIILCASVPRDAKSDESIDGQMMGLKGTELAAAMLLRVRRGWRRGNGCKRRTTQRMQ